MQGNRRLWISSKLILIPEPGSRKTRGRRSLGVGSKLMRRAQKTEIAICKEMSGQEGFTYRLPPKVRQGFFNPVLTDALAYVGCPEQTEDDE